MCDYQDTEVCWACDGDGAGESGRQCRRCMGTGEFAIRDDDDDGLDCFSAPEPREADEGEGEP